MKTPTLKKNNWHSKNKSVENDLWSPVLLSPKVSFCQDIVWDGESPSVIERIRKQEARKGLKKERDLPNVIQQLSKQINHFQNQNITPNDDEFWQSFIPLESHNENHYRISDNKQPQNMSSFEKSISQEIPNQLQLLVDKLKSEHKTNCKNFKENEMSPLSVTNGSLLADFNDDFLSDELLESAKEIEEAFFDAATQTYKVPIASSSPALISKALTSLKRSPITTRETFRIDNNLSLNLRSESPIEELLNRCQEISRKCNQHQRKYNEDEFNFSDDEFDYILSSLVPDNGNIILNDGINSLQNDKKNDTAKLPYFDPYNDGKKLKPEKADQQAKKSKHVKRNICMDYY